MSAKRFTDSSKWDDPWFCELDNEKKLVWIYILDKCDHAGVYKINLRLLNFHLNTSYNSWSTLAEGFNKRLITLNEELCFVPKFLKFQYNKGLNINNNCLKSVRTQLEKYNLSNIVNELFGDSFLTLDEGLNNPSPRVKEKEQEKEQEKDKEQEKEKRISVQKKSCELFETWWDLYGKKTDRKRAEQKWNTLSLAEKQQCLNVVEAYVQSTPNLQFRKDPKTYLNNRSWENEITKSNEQAFNDFLHIAREEAERVQNRIAVEGWR